MTTLDLDLSLLSWLIPLLLLIEGFFSGSEIALLSADKWKLKALAGQGSKRADLALFLAQNPEKVLSSTLVMVSLCVILISSVITIYIESRYESNTELITILVTSPLIVIFGELIPKSFFQKYATRMAPWVSYPVQIVYWIFYPFTKSLSLYTSRLSHVLAPLGEIVHGKSGNNEARDELITLLSYGKRESEITVSEKRMIRRIFDFKGTEAKSVLIPLIKVEAIEENASIKDALERFKIHRHSRMPVYSGRIDNIVGVLEVSDLFHAQDTQQSIRNTVSNAHYISETHHLDDLLRVMRREEVEMVIVVDEYGGAIGVLTFEDIVEEIVGEIEDEHDDMTTHFKEIGEKSWLVQAKMEITAINEQLHLDIPEGDYETLSGFLLKQFAKIPEPGDELYFDTHAGTLKFSVRKANERQIQSVIVEILKAPIPAAEN